MDFIGTYLIFAAISNLNLNSFTMKVKAFFRLSSFLLLLYGCTDTWEELTREEKRRQESAAFSFEEAHTFFEEVMEHIPVTRSSQALQSDGVNFPTGEFTVRWEDARQVQRGDIVFFDMPIETRMQYTAHYEMPFKDSLYRRSAPIYQRLMVMRNTARQRDVCYITTFIPDSDELGMSDCVKCMRGDASGRYSGVVLYLDLYNFRPVRVDQYEDGRRTAGIYLSGEVYGALDKVKYARSLMGYGYVRISQRMVMTRLDSDKESPDLSDDGIYMGNGYWLYYSKDHRGKNVMYMTVDWNEDGEPDGLSLCD